MVFERVFKNFIQSNTRIFFELRQIIIIFAGIKNTNKMRTAVVLYPIVILFFITNCSSDNSVLSIL